MRITGLGVKACGGGAAEMGRLMCAVRSLIDGGRGFLGLTASVLHARVDHPQGCVGERVAGQCMRTATPLSAVKGGRASGWGESEAETVGGRVVIGSMHIMMEFSTQRLRYEGCK